MDGEYVVTTVNGRQLPVNVADQSSPRMLLADTMRFDGKGTATHSWTLREPSSLQPAPLTKLSQTLYYSFTGAAIDFSICPPGAPCLWCPPNADCNVAPPPTGHIVLGLSWLVLDYGQSRYVYQRVR